jgi:hypothetical protein
VAHPDRGTAKAGPIDGGDEVSFPTPAPEQRNPAFPRATKVLGTLRRFAEFCAENDPATVASAVMPHEVKATTARAAVVAEWLARFVASAERKRGSV